MLKELVTLTPTELIMICVTMAGIGACIAHWADVRWPSPRDREDAE